MKSVATAMPSSSNAAADQVLLTRGEHASLGDLYDSYGSTAYSLALTITRDPARAERIVTAAFATTWREFSSVITNARAATFFAALVANVRDMAVAEGKPLSGAVTFDRPNGRHSGSSLVIANALQNLPAAQQHVLALAYFGGLAVSEIAVRMREPAINVKESLQAALGGLRALLTEQPRGAAQ